MFNFIAYFIAYFSSHYIFIEKLLRFPNILTQR